MKYTPTYPKIRSLVIAMTAFAVSGLYADTASLNPVADAHVRNGSNADNNYGTSSSFETRNNGAAYRRSYIKFDISGISGTVSEAILGVYANTSGSTQTTNAHAVSDTSWTETGITWNNMPSIGSSLDSIQIDTSSYTYWELDVTSHVASAVAASADYVTIALENSTDNVAVNKFRSREYSNSGQRPILDITYVTGGGSVPSITSQPQSDSVYIGDNVSFSVTASGSPSPTYQWRLDGNNLSGQTGSTLSLTNVQTSDAGDYDVVVTNSNGSVTSNDATLTVNGSAPSIISHPQGDTVTEGDNVTFSVTASGDPSPSYQWRLDGSNLSGETGSSLNLTNVQTSDAGDYDVVVTNTYGSITSNDATLVVNAASGPIIDEDFSSGAGNFTVVDGGTWSVSSGRYFLTSPATGPAAGVLGNISVHNTSVSGDFVLTAVVNLTATSSWDDAAVIFGYQDDDNYYYVSLNENNDGNTKGIFKVVSGSATQMADITVTIEDDTDYDLEIVRDGSSIIAKVDGSQVASASDSTFTSGKVGFGSYNDAAAFDDLLVTGPGGGDTEAPSVPTGLSSSNVTHSSVDLSWNASTDNVGVSGYKVYINGSSPVSVTGTSTTISGLSAETSYTFTVTAYDAAINESAQSTGVNVTTDETPDTQAPSVPTGLSASDITDSSVDLDWNASTDNVGVTGYKVHIDGSNPISVTGTSVTISGLSADTSYTFTVSAYDAASNESSQSSGVNVTTNEPPDTQAPSVPTGLAASNVTPTTVDLDWNASTDNVGVIGYKIYINGSNPVSVTGTSITLTGLTEDTSYAFTVSASDAANNESSQSGGVNVTTGSSTGTLISEDFSSGASNFSVVSGGTWSVSGGRYVLSSPASSGTNGVLGNISVQDTTISGDFVLTATMNITGTGSAWNDAAIVFGYQDSSNYYYLSLNESNDGNTKGLFKVVSGSPTELADISISVASDTDYPIEIARSGSSIIAKVNSSQAASATDSTFTSGKVGFGSFNDGAEFDNLAVTGSIDTQAPTTPSGLAASNITDTTVDLDWNASTDNVIVAGYKIYTGGSNPVSVTGTSVTLTGLSPDTSYTFTVSAVDGVGNESSQSSGVNVTTEEELQQVVAPQFSPGGGTYSSTQSVTITTSTSGATIRYTTDGSPPSQSNGIVYSTAVSISSSSTLKAIAYKSGMSDSAVTSAAYTIGSTPAKPNASNTGPSGTLTNSGGITANVNGMIIENLNISGSITVKANNVTIRNCRINGGTYGINAMQSGPYTGLLIEDCEILNSNSAGIYGRNFTVRRTEFHEMFADAIKPRGNVTVEQCYFHNLGKTVGSHADVVQAREGGSNHLFRYNNMDIPSNPPPTGYRHNSCFILEIESGSLPNFVIDQNWLNGGNYTIYVEVSGVSITNNKFGRDYQFGLRSGSPDVWSGNVWEDNGQPVP